MRTLKILLILLLSMGGVVAALGLAGQGHWQAGRSTTVQAPAGAVWEHMGTLAALESWSLRALDPEAVLRAEGPDGAPGAWMEWQGNDRVGRGRLRIDSVVPGKRLRLQLRFSLPWPGQAVATVALAAQGDSTRVDAMLEGERGFMEGLRSRFTEGETLLGTLVAESLERLKRQAEEAYARTPKPAIEALDWPGRRYAGREIAVPWAERGGVASQGLEAVRSALAAAGVGLAGPASVVYGEAPAADSPAAILAAFPIADSAEPVGEGFVVRELPAGQAIALECSGGFAQQTAARRTLEAHLAERGLGPASAVIEERLIGPAEEPDSARWRTRIICLYP